MYHDGGAVFVVLVAGDGDAPRDEVVCINIIELGTLLVFDEFLRLLTVLVGSILTRNALEIDSPSKRQVRVRGLLAMVLWFIN